MSSNPTAVDTELLGNFNGNAAQPAASAGGWHSSLLVHPAANCIPEPSDEEKRALAADLKHHGQRVPVTLVCVASNPDPRPQVLDGRTRLDLLEAAGIRIVDSDGQLLVPHRVMQVQDDVEAEALSLSLNVHRRHLNVEQRQLLLIERIAGAPEKSDRQFGKEIGVDHKVIARARAKGEATGAVAPVEKRVGGDGKARKQPAVRNKNRNSIYRRMKLGDDTVDAIKGTSLDSAQELDELVMLNRGAPVGELAPIVKQLVADAVAGRDVSAVAITKAGVAGFVTDHAAREHNNKDLAEQLRLAEIKIVGLESEIKELKAENAELRTKLDEVAQGAAAASPKIAADTATAGDPGPIPDFLQRKPKLTASTSRAGVTLQDAVTDAFNKFGELGNECREVVDNAPAGVDQTNRIQTLGETADVLENLSEPDVAAELAEIRIVLPEPHRLRSRHDRRDAALGIIEACSEALDAIDESDPRHPDACRLCEELQSASAEAEHCEFPGMCG